MLTPAEKSMSPVVLSCDDTTHSKEVAPPVRTKNISATGRHFPYELQELIVKCAVKQNGQSPWLDLPHTGCTVNAGKGYLRMLLRLALVCTDWRVLVLPHLFAVAVLDCDPPTLSIDASYIQLFSAHPKYKDMVRTVVLRTFGYHPRMPKGVSTLYNSIARQSPCPMENLVLVKGGLTDASARRVKGSTLLRSVALVECCLTRKGIWTLLPQLAEGGKLVLDDILFWPLADSRPQVISADPQAITIALRNLSTITSRGDPFMEILRGVLLKGMTILNCPGLSLSRATAREIGCNMEFFAYENDGAYDPPFELEDLPVLQKLHVVLNAAGLEEFYDWLLAGDSSTLLDVVVNIAAFGMDPRDLVAKWSGIADALAPCYFGNLERVRIRFFAGPGSCLRRASAFTQLRGKLHAGSRIVEIDVVAEGGGAFTEKRWAF
ncbi:hypothetical protein CYLTODRAFT_415486 [Cylindrobasidium torrendii FP15055 ss-10]|uniref:F-box domain-containing protein n=1 Tax=Cylindrobasidium torrendii FP15055 ss-10 TaxID=1314674 RepID=A0A0D7ASM6_9AGAR|nr:hypothetical protein CYLTODRAFT_415486 [Cylindrobasidium torrendii FP15055 ss-10]